MGQLKIKDIKCGIDTVDEWVYFVAKFKFEEPNIIGNTLCDGDVHSICRQVLESREFAAFKERNRGKTVEAGQDGSYTEVMVQKNIYIPRSIHDFSEWWFSRDDGEISASTR